MGALVFGIVCAAATGVALFLWFGPPKKETLVSFSHENIPVENLEHLRESARLAELQIKEFNEATATLEKKAVLLITLCAALLAYVGAADFNHSQHEFIRGAAFVFLIVSAVVGAKVVDLGRQGMAGLTPAISEHYAEHAGGEATALMLRFTLDKYQSIINNADETHKEKSRIFRIAKVFLIIGFSCALAWTVADFSVTFGAGNTNAPPPAQSGQATPGS